MPPICQTPFVSSNCLIRASILVMSGRQTQISTSFWIHIHGYHLMSCEEALSLKVRRLHLPYSFCSPTFHLIYFLKPYSSSALLLFSNDHHAYTQTTSEAKGLILPMGDTFHLVILSANALLICHSKSLLQQLALCWKA